MKNLLGNKLILGIIFAVIGLLVLYYYFGSDRKNELTMGLVVRQDLSQRVTIAGTTTPIKKSLITAPYDGYIKKIFVKIGDRVKLGDPLVSVGASLQEGDNAFPLRSPLNGIVVQILKSEGEYVQQLGTNEFILRVDDMSQLYIEASTPEIDWVKLKIGQDAVIRATAILNKSYKGIIKELSLAAREKDRNSRSQVVEFPIKIMITDADDELKPGMSVLVDIITLKKEKILTLRHEFIRRDKDKYFVILKSGERIDIQVGFQNDEAIEILSGLNEGDQIQQIDFADMNSEE